MTIKYIYFDLLFSKLGSCFTSLPEPPPKKTKDLYVNNFTPGERQDIDEEMKATGASTKPEAITQIAHNSRSLRRIASFLDSISVDKSDFISVDKNIKDLLSKFVKFKELPPNLRKAQTFTKLERDFPDVPMEVLIECVQKIEASRNRSK